MIGHTCGVRVDGPPARGLWPPFGGGLCKRVVNGKVLKMDGPSAQGFLGLTAFQAEGCGIARRAMSIKSALRDWLFVSYVTQYPVPPIFSFPLEGKSREAGKGVRGRAPIGCSIAVLTANRRPPERSDAQNVVSRFPFRGR